MIVRAGAAALLLPLLSYAVPVALAQPGDSNVVHAAPPSGQHGNPYWRDASAWREGKGAGIWLAPGSDENEVSGNTFEEIARLAIVLEGDRNRVETRGPAGALRDLGSGNRVSGPRLHSAAAGDTAPDENVDMEAVEAAIRGYFDAYAAMNPDLLRTRTTDDFLLIENGYMAGLDRLVEGMDPAGALPFTHYVVEDLQIEVSGEMAVYRIVVDWYRGETRADGGVGTGHLRRSGGGWKMALDHMTLLPGRRRVSADTLNEYAGEYTGLDAGGGDDRLRLELDGVRLFMTRTDGRPLFGGIRRLELIPDALDAFHLEFWGALVEFERGDGGEVETLVYQPPPRMPAASRQPLRYGRVR